jgi:hypothetical protein
VVSPRRSEAGAVTAEAAVALPVLVLLAVALSWVVCLGVTQVRAVDAARETARSLARGESSASGIALGERIAPAGAQFQVRHDGDVVSVTVSAQVRGPGGVFRFVPGFLAHAEAVAAMEPGQ